MKNPTERRAVVAPLLLYAVGYCLLAPVFAGCSSHEEIWAEGRPKHHTTEGFRNYPVVPEPRSAGFAFYVRRVWGSFFRPDVPADHFLPEKDAIAQYKQLGGRDSLTWIGHATFLITLNGKRILTDPFLTETASPFRMFGPRRFVPPGIGLENLPAIDIIVVSHNHLDHLDEETVESLPGKENIRVFVPLGLKSFFLERGYRNVTELDWYESHTYGDIRFTALPTVHFSRRGLFDGNKTLWCSWSLSTATGKYYFSGDTADSPSIFRETGQHDGPYDLAMIPIAAYKIVKEEHSAHIAPEQAVKIGGEIGADTMVAMHWGTIELSDEPHWEPPVRFTKAAREAGMSDDQIWVMKIGETRPLPKHGSSSR